MSFQGDAEGLIVIVGKLESALGLADQMNMTVLGAQISAPLEYARLELARLNAKSNIVRNRRSDVDHEIK